MRGTLTRQLGLVVLVLAVLTATLVVTNGASGAPARAAGPGASKVDPAAVATAKREGVATVLVHLSEQADLSGAHQIHTKAERGRWVMNRLQEVSNRTQPSLVRFLQSRGAGVERFWISNLVVARVDERTLSDLAVRKDVARVTLRGTLELIEPVDMSKGVTLPAPDILERGLREIGVDDVWRLGYRGEGVVVAVSDTGAAWEHPALKGTYRGAEGGVHDYNWLDAVSFVDTPVDANGHGSHVLGTVVGKAGPREIGAAPGAQWIACRLIEQRAGGDEQILRCMQWFLAPTKVDGRTDPRPELAPDVINASWGESPGDTCLSTSLLGAINSLSAAGIMFVASGGNSGSDCNTVCSPGAFRNVLTVANYDVQSRKINDTSSRGPVQWPEGNVIKPDISAPGTNINSSVPPNGYGEKSGTSMAAPHITGVVALILSAQPNLRGETEGLKSIVMETGKEIAADRCGPGGSRGYNNAAGHGLVQADDAVKVALSATPRPTATSTPTRTPTPEPTDTPTITLTPERPRGTIAFLPRALTR